MPLQSSSFFKPENGRYLGVFLGLKDGKMVEHTKDDGRKVAEPTMLWQFQLYDLQTRQPVANPLTGETPAVAEGMSSQTTGVSNTGQDSKARTWLRALLAAKGMAFDADALARDPNGVAQSVIGAQVILNFGRSPRAGKDGTLLSIEPPAPSVPGIGAPTPPPPVNDPTTVAAPIPVPVPEPVGARAEIPVADYDNPVPVTGL